MKELLDYINWMKKWSFSTIDFRYQDYYTTSHAHYELGDEIKELRRKIPVVPQLVVLEDYTTKWEIKPNTIIYTYTYFYKEYKVKVFKGKNIYLHR